MGITFNGVDVAGTFESPLISPWARQKQRTEVFGLFGETELIGRRTIRTIVIPCWIHNGFISAADLQTYLETIEDLADEREATLAETGAMSRSFPFCKFERWEHELGPLPSTSLGWFISGRLVFEQLEPP